MVPSSLIDTMRADGDPLEALARHRDGLRRLEDLAETYLARGQYDDAAGTADTAAWLAELNHPGVLASPRLESVLTEISSHHLPPASLLTPADRAVERTPGTERVLVVVTETYDSGGHTRTLWRWIARDPNRAYSVASTAQRGVMPDGLRAAIDAGGGEIFDIPSGAPPLQRAAELRALAAGFDLIVLFDHPYDPVPALAFAGLRPRPPIVMFNHGDHLFWLGRDIVDVLMSIRPAAVELGVRRGLPSERVLPTAFPVWGPDGHGREACEPLDAALRAEARRQVLSTLGWPEDTVVLATVGTHFKWDGPPGHGLLDLIEPVLAAMPQARLVAAGARDEGRWQEMRLATGGRVIAAGVLPDGVGALLSAADVYLDSRPLGGMGAPSEAAAHGLPVLTGAATEVEALLLAAEEGYGATCIVGNDAYREMLGRLIAEPELRSRLGEHARCTVQAADGAWEASVEQAFALARSLGPLEASQLVPLPEPDGRDVVIDWCTSFRGRSLATLHANLTVRELIAGFPALRQLYGPLEHRAFRQIGRFPAAFATPAAEAEALRATVSHLRLLSQLGAAERYMIALAPEHADVAVPVLESALAEGPDFDLELTLAADPETVRPPGSLPIAA